MKLKSVVTIALILFVSVSVVYLIVGESLAPATNTESAGETAGPAVAASDSESAGEAEGTSPRVIAYYFHGTARCTTCRTIEQYARDALTLGFAEEIKAGALEWRVVDVQQPGNDHYIDDYQLQTRSVILARMERETQVQWKNLDQVWELVGDRTAFVAYVQDEARSFMEDD